VSIRTSPELPQRLSAGAEKTIRVWKVESGEAIRQFEDAGTARFICVSPDGKKGPSHCMRKSRPVVSAAVPVPRRASPASCLFTRKEVPSWNHVKQI
jgi:hypothetical protein